MSQSKDMLNSYLYSTTSVIDRLIAPQSRTLRCDSTKVHPVPLSSERDKVKQVEAFVSRLEKEMDKITDPNLLADARMYQQGT